MPALADSMQKGTIRASARSDSTSHPHPARIVPQAAIDHVRDGNYEAALPFYRDAVRKSPDNADAHESLGIILVASRHFDDAIGEFREAIRLNANNASYRRSLALALIQIGRVEEGIAALSVAIRLAPHEEEAYTELGIAHLNLGRFIEAIQNFSSSLALRETTRARFGRIVALYRSGQYAAAIADCDHVLRKHPSNHQAFAYRAYANMRRGEFEAAKHDAEQALATGGEFADLANTVLGGLSLERSDFDSAIEMLSKAIEFRRKQPLPFVFRALAHFNSGQWDKTIADLSGAIECSDSPYDLNFALDGYGWQIYKFRGFLFLQSRKDADTALKDLTQAIALNEHDPDCYVLRGCAHFELSDWKSAIADFNKALSLEPDHLLGKFFLTQVLLICPNKEIRDPARALGIATEACEQTTWSRPEFLNYVAAAHSELGDFVTASSVQSLVVKNSRGPGKVNIYPLKMWWDSAPAFISLGVSEEGAVDTLKLYEQRKPYRFYSKQIADESENVEVPLHLGKEG
jgi:tetratricopeptide (TPR) repeat protein